MSGRPALVLLRGFENSEDIIAAASRAGFDPLIEPILIVDYVDLVLPEITAQTSLVFTSANAVRGFALKSNVRDAAVYAVGPNTAAAARGAGFRAVETGAGTVEQLAMRILSLPAEPGRRFLYLRGETVSYDLARALDGKGVKVVEAIVYRTVPAETLSLALLDRLDREQIAAIGFFSQAGITAFVDLLEQYERVHRLHGIKALCLGDAMVQSVSVLPFKEVLVAGTPDRYGMIALIEKIT